MKLTKARLQQIIKEEVATLLETRRTNNHELEFPMVDNPDGYVDLFAEFWDEERTYNDELEDDAQPDYDDVKMWASDQFSSNEAKKIASYVFNKLKGMKNI